MLADRVASAGHGAGNDDVGVQSSPLPAFGDFARWRSATQDDVSPGILFPYAPTDAVMSENLSQIFAVDTCLKMSDMAIVIPISCIMISET
jgi:hypothetical protein